MQRCFWQDGAHGRFYCRVARELGSGACYCSGLGQALGFQGPGAPVSVAEGSGGREALLPPPWYFSVLRPFTHIGFTFETLYIESSPEGECRLERRQCF